MTYQDFKSGATFEIEGINGRYRFNFKGRYIEQLTGYNWRIIQREVQFSELFFRIKASVWGCENSINIRYCFANVTHSKLLTKENKFG